MSLSFPPLSKISYRQEMSIESRLDSLKGSIGEFSEKAKNALDSVQTSFSCVSLEPLTERATPPHIAVEYIDLILIPEGYYLKRQLELVKNWLENYQSQEWVKCKGDGTCRKLQFSVDTPIQNLTTCRDNFRKAVAPLEEKTPAAVKHAMGRWVKGALDGFMPGSDGDSCAVNGSDFQEKGMYNLDSYSQQVLQALHPESLQEDSDDEFGSESSFKQKGFTSIKQSSQGNVDPAKESINDSPSSDKSQHNNSAKSF